MSLDNSSLLYNTGKFLVQPRKININIVIKKNHQVLKEKTLGEPDRKNRKYTTKNLPTSVEISSVIRTDN